MKTRAAFGSMGSMKMDGSGSSDLLLGSSRSRTGRYFSPLARSIVHIYMHCSVTLHIYTVTGGFMTVCRVAVRREGRS